jgi:hypothetical protein
MTLKDTLEREGFAKTGDFGGQPKITYWTPDGRQIRAMPDMHEYARKDAKGKVIESGLRDANLDKGWLTSKPQILQKYCPGCDKWHQTDVEVKECIRKKNALVSKHSKIAKKELKQSDDSRLDKLESDMGELKDMFKQLMEKM